jgi:hypothetical protein
MRGWLSGFSPFIAAAGLLVLALTPVAALQSARYGLWAEPTALMGTLGLLLLGLSRR